MTGSNKPSSLTTKRERKIANYKKQKEAKEKIKELESLLSHSSELENEEVIRDLSIFELKHNIGEVRQF